MVIAMTKPPLSDSLLFRLFAFVNKNITCVHSYSPDLTPFLAIHRMKDEHSK